MALKPAKLYSLILIGLILVLCGCSKSDNPGAAGSNPVNKPNVQTADALPNANPNVPLDQYTPLTSGNQVMFIYYGLLNMPIDYDTIASLYSKDYRVTNDAFRKKDILNALKPQIDTEIAKGKENRYFHAEFKADLGHFDFNAKGFPVKKLFDINGYALFSDNPRYEYSFTNGESFRIIKVADEAKAREIESMVNYVDPGKIVLYFFAQRAIPNYSRIECQIVKVRLLDHQGKELLVQ